MTWKDLLSHPNTRVTVVEENSNLEQELLKAMEAIELIEELDCMKKVPVAVKLEVIEKEKEECTETLFPMIWNESTDELFSDFFAVRLSSEKYIAARATIVFPIQEERILLVCKSEL